MNMSRHLHCAAAVLPLLLTACGGDSASPVANAPPAAGTPPVASAPPQLAKAEGATLLACSALTAMGLPNTRVTSAAVVPAGMLGTQQAPEHCLVQGLMHERTGINGNYAIGFEMRLPKAWNGRFFYQANGGADGTVSTAVGESGPGTDTTALSMGFAVLSSDAGHNGAQNNIGPDHFGLDPQARLDYGYQAVGKLTPMGRQVVNAAYGKVPDRMYMGGCSNGGRHAMVAASRYADQYDGILAGNPGFNLPKSAIQVAWDTLWLNTVAESTAKLSTAVTATELNLVADRVLARCDALDGLKDGMVLDVQACQTTFKLDLDVPTCTGARDGSCLSTAQKTALGKIFGGAKNAAGMALYASFPYDPGMRTGGWSVWKYFINTTLGAGAMPYIFTTPANALAPNALVNGLLNYSMETDAPKISAVDGLFTESAMSFMTPPNADRLFPLRDRGAKLMVYHGTADPVFSSNDTADWYAALRKTHGEDTANFARYYPVAGMNHCSGGVATDRFDMLTALVDWVEDGRAPNQITAAVRPANTDLASTGWSSARTRPLCPFPKVARYQGGNTESAASFSCE